MCPFWSASGGCIQFLVPGNKESRDQSSAIFANTGRIYASERQVTHLRFYSVDFYYSPNSAPISVTLSSSCCRLMATTDFWTDCNIKKYNS